MTIVDRKSGSASGVSTSDRLGGIPEGIGVKAPVRLATAANITLSGLQSIDGSMTAEGDRVLVKDQTAGAENGIRIASSGNWARATDFSVNGHVVEGTRVYVNQGATNGNTEWAVTTDDDIVIDTSSIAFTNVTLAAAPSVMASQSEAEAGAINTNHMSPLRTKQAIQKRVISILDYGAIGDGNIANASTNAAALTSALATGHPVLIPWSTSGYHFGTNQITLDNGATIIGENQVKIISTATTSWLKIVATNYPLVQVSNLWIDMTGSGASSVAILMATATTYVFAVRIDRIYATNCVKVIADEVHATNYVVDLSVTDCRLAYTRGVQIHLRRSRGFTYLYRVQVDHSNNVGAVTWNGIQFDAVAGIELHRVDVTGPATATTYQSAVYGISITGGSGAYNAAVWLNRVNVDNGGGNGLLLDSINYIWALDLDIVSNLGNQIVIQGCTKAEIANILTIGAVARTGAAAGANGIMFGTCTHIHGTNISTESNTQNGVSLVDTTDCVFTNIRSISNSGTGWIESGTSDRNLKSNGVFSGNAADYTEDGTDSAFFNYLSSGTFQALALKNGGTGAKTAATARTALGLGTAAVKNTGASGDAVPLLNVANTWTLTQNFTVALQVAGTQVVGARVTGYTNAMTGTANRATSYATGTITLVQLAERVKAIEDDMIAHGLIGV